MRRLRAVWVIVYTGGDESEFPTMDMNSIWTTKTAAVNQLKRSSHRNNPAYEVRKYEFRSKAFRRVRKEQHGK